MFARIIGWATGGAVMPWLIVIGMAMAAVGGGAAGAQIATWRAKADHAEAVLDLGNQINTLTDEKNTLMLEIERQNAAVDVAKAQTEASDAAKAQAERHASDLAVFSKSRMDKLQQAFTSATSCDAVLKKYWEIRQ